MYRHSHQFPSTNTLRQIDNWVASLCNLRFQQLFDSTFSTFDLPLIIDVVLNAALIARQSMDWHPFIAIVNSITKNSWVFKLKYSNYYYYLFMWLCRSHN